MVDLTRRGSLAALIAGGAAASASQAGAATPTTAPKWGEGFEGQRKADLGDGRFLNPILAGDHPDPTIVRDGDEWWMTFSSFDAYPGLVLWRSRDLVNWTPVTAALKTPIGSVWAPELVKHEGCWFLYIPARRPEGRTIWVITADHPSGPWSEPVDLHLPNHIDPGHAVGEDGSRWLFLSGGDRIRLADDGLSTIGAVEHVYDPWRYPDDWDVESFSPEGPKVLRRGEWFYLVTAVGGTAGPPTGHMVIAARSRSIHGPWEHHPNNPIVRTRSNSEKWWSRGHATLVEGPGGGWWMVYHGYENGFWTLGRQCLLDPVEWTADGWFRAKGGDLSKPLGKPKGGTALPHGLSLSDDFSTDKLGVQWGFYDPAPGEAARLTRQGGALVMAAKGAQPRDCSPLAFVAGDPAYRIEVELEVEPGAQAGVLLFYSRRLYCGLGWTGERFVMHRYGLERNARAPEGYGRRIWLRLTNDRHVVTLHHSSDGRTWKKFDVQMEVSGYHHNTAGDFLSLRPALFAAGTGQARFKDVRYRAL
ncbi:family 43 glycosylhydrolase [Caulobacter sp. 17J65-9]|uniref:family 43 glycosylhydrolase n=1 Tax=Caulobacter sp. 17J65-9 TaxID=2709382 RepID=UPI0013C8DE8A|nr:family 43 glycosylhydrolase [Caulobacter sp. 17J65-9]NEX92740.1 family 43 glycosylhydrolase [Caulobacter sp. 17J65-9]